MLIYQSAKITTILIIATLVMIQSSIVDTKNELYHILDRIIWVLWIWVIIFGSMY